ncbi:hypothetical protein [Quadrisphaera granulorum]|uniref:hypothetical protein n=1 Tax=Quadrisphaera granulorum TaxID=317664 RepID=UPI000D6AE996|nr:hypothetical protein [Quadrisphaera granulorum]
MRVTSSEGREAGASAGRRGAGGITDGAALVVVLVAAIVAASLAAVAVAVAPVLLAAAERGSREPRPPLAVRPSRMSRTSRRRG